jgi:hypothetical protein
METPPYREVVTRILTEEAQYVPVNGDIAVCPLFDPIHDQYQVLYVGWEDEERVFVPLLHLRLHEGKIWIEQDGTEDGVANRLVAAGVPHEDIVLAFHPPRKRPYTEFAVA